MCFQISWENRQEVEVVYEDKLFLTKARWKTWTVSSLNEKGSKRTNRTTETMCATACIDSPCPYN